jgi:hypothetical protein
MNVARLLSLRTGHLYPPRHWVATRAVVQQEVLNRRKIPMSPLTIVILPFVDSANCHRWRPSKGQNNCDFEMGWKPQIISCFYLISRMFMIMRPFVMQHMTTVAVILLVLWHKLCKELTFTPSTSSSSIGSTSLVSVGLLNCRWAFSAGRFYRVPLPAARLIPNLEENQRFIAF